LSWLGTFTDITDRKRAQLERELLLNEAVDKLRARDEFLSVTSHELKTPVSSLSLQLQTLLRRPPSNPEQTRAKLEMAQRQVDRLTRLITELMDVSRITAGRLRLELDEIDLSVVVREVVARLGEDAALAQSTVEIRAEAAVVGRWDRFRLEQVVTNLLTNAFKFGGGKPIEVTVEAAGPVGRLRVADHGIGIAVEDLERIFHRYEQASSKRPHQGLGLGLYIARQIVEAHGGTIQVESVVGAGARFTVELPREPPEGSAHRPSAESREARDSRS
jgi:signal transduction histidine kinase